MNDLEINDEVIGPSGQKYILSHRSPYRRPNGTLSEILHWRSTCRKCGEPFTCKSGPTARGASVHCPAHRISREERTKIALANLKTGLATRRRNAQLRKLL